MAIRAVLFDYGGTLDGEASHWLDRFVELYREAGVELPFEGIKAAFYRADDAIYAHPGIAEAPLRDLMEAHVAAQLEALEIEGRALHDRLVNTFVDRSQAAMAASQAVLQKLARHFRLGVVSNFYGNVGRILADADLAPLLAVIADSGALGVGKPDPRIFTYAVTALDVLPGETLHVGDSYERDVLAARAAGLRTAWLTRDGQRGPRAGESVADLRIDSLPDLVGLLLENRRASTGRAR